MKPTLMMAVPLIMYRTWSSTLKELGRQNSFSVQMPTKHCFNTVEQMTRTWDHLKIFFEWKILIKNHILPKHELLIAWPDIHYLPMWTFLCLFLIGMKNELEHLE